MAHRVRLIQGYSFRLNLSCTAPYNADFGTSATNPAASRALSDSLQSLARAQTETR